MTAILGAGVVPLALEMMGFAGADVREGAAALREKRPPSFSPDSPF